MDKAALRKQIAQRRGALSPEYVRAAGADIARAVLASPQYQRAGTIFIYVSTPLEPDTRAILEDAWRGGKAVYVPRCRKKPEMDMVRMERFQELAPGTLGILEPAAEKPADNAVSPELAIVPCVSAARDGRRLGHGGGYYDAFLSGRDVTKLCLCFAELLCDDIPVAEHDVRMDYVATEHGILDCRGEA